MSFTQSFIVCGRLSDLSDGDGYANDGSVLLSFIRRDNRSVGDRLFKMLLPDRKILLV